VLGVGKVRGAEGVSAEEGDWLADQGVTVQTVEQSEHRAWVDHLPWRRRDGARGDGLSGGRMGVHEEEKERKRKRSRAPAGGQAGRRMMVIMASK
jgi:hypothetical protein